MASQLGAADYNRELSRRREENVKHFLTSRGVSPGRLTTTFSGEDLSTSRLEDDEHDRAVGVWLQVVNTGRPRVIPNTPSPADTFKAPPEFDAPRLRLGFALGGSPVFANVLPSLIPSTIELRPNEDRSCTVINAAGREMFLKKEGTPTSSKQSLFRPREAVRP